MRKILCLLMSCFISAQLCTYGVFAEGKEQQTVSGADFHFIVDLSNVIIPDTVCFELCVDGETYTQSAFINQLTDSFDIHFDTEPYALYTPMILTLTGGAAGVQFYETIYGAGDSMQMCAYTLEGDSRIINDFSMTCFPNHRFRIDMYKDYVRMELTQPAYLDGDTCMVPIIEVAKSLGLDAYYDKEYNSVYTGIGDKSVLFNLDTTYATVLGQDTELPAAPVFIGWTVMAPLRTLTDAFASEVTVQDEGGYYNVNIGRSEAVKEYNDTISKAYMVNGIGSRTNYLIWVSKYEYTVRVYQGQKGDWQLIKSYPCAIGAPGTPTVTGQFEYIEKQAYWNYGSYYCGPIMRFYNGYALHSTLQYWNGGAYDGRVGMMISHGCVRMNPPDINWLADNIPLHTRIYITN